MYDAMVIGQALMRLKHRRNEAAKGKCSEGITEGRFLPIPGKLPQLCVALQGIHEDRKCLKWRA